MLNYRDQQELLGKLDDGFSNYREKWAKTADILEEGGIYKEIATFIGNQKLHVDLGCGSGAILEQLLVNNLSERVIGIDINRHMLRDAEDRLKKIGEVNKFVCLEEIITKLDDKALDSVRENYKRIKGDNLSKINLVLGDARFLNSLDKLRLDGKHLESKADSISSTFIGGLFYTVAEGSSDFSNRPGKSYITSVLRQGYRYLNNDGEFTFATRVFCGESSEVPTARVVRRALPEDESLYSLEEIKILPFDFLKGHDSVDLVPSNYKKSDFNKPTPSLTTQSLKESGEGKIALVRLQKKT